jgi:uncharacterized delta-60 repeat protein
MNTTSLTVFRPTKRWFATLCAATALLAPFGLSYAQVPGSFDTTFGSTNGYVPALAIGTNDDDRANAIALQPDGKIILAGTCARTLGKTFCMARLMPDGALDPDFDGPGTTPGNGKFLMTVAASIDADAVAIALQPDGKIIVAGTCLKKFCVARLNENGSFDTTFVGPSGTSAGSFSFSISAAADDKLNAMALQADGKIVLVGTCNDDSGDPIVLTLICVARLNTDGSLDTSFDGPVTLSPGNGKFSIPRIATVSSRETASAVVIRPSGKTLLAGQCAGEFCFVQLNASGTYDTTFDGPSNGNGRFLLPTIATGFSNFVTGMVLQADGYAVIVGRCGATGCAMRITLSGVRDPSFGGGTSHGVGVAQLGNGVAFPLHASFQFDGRLLVAGDGFRVHRLNVDGSPDQSFDGPPPSDGNGTFLLPITASPKGAQAITTQPDGKIVIAGYCDSDAGSGISYKFCIARLNGGPFAARNCSPDIDGDGRMTATVDALINTRVMLGLTGSAVTGGITFPANATRNSWSEIRDYLVSQCGMAIAP